MSYQRVQGIVIKSVELKETDKIIDILTAEGDLISIMVRGAKRFKSGLTASTQMFCYSDFDLYQAGRYSYINNCSVINTFEDVSKDPILLIYGVHMAEIIREITSYGEYSDQFLSILLNALYLLGRIKDDESLTHKAQQIVRTFEYRVLCISGYELDLTKLNISDSAKSCLRYIARASNKKVYLFSVSAPVLEELNKIVPRHLERSFEKSFNTLDMLEDFNYNI